jgi:GDP-L-fucose synthase
MKEMTLLSGPLEPTNEAYAVAKIAGIKLCQAYHQQYGVNFICAIPANTFGPGDDFSREDSHVVPALIRRMHEAKKKGEEFIEIWGTGNPKREFIFADDLADACLFVMGNYHDQEPINLGGGTALAIKELAETIKEVVGYEGRLRFDPSKPDGMPIKVLDSNKLRGMGWRPVHGFKSSLEATYNWFVRSGNT